MAGIEDELKKVFRVASDLTADDQPTVRELPALAALTLAAGQGVGRQYEQTPKTVLVKTEKRISKPKASPPKVRAPEAKASHAKRAGAAGSQLQLRGSPAKLFRHFEHVLNANEFAVIGQTAVAQETEIPIGSMTAATKKLIENGRIIAGPAGSFMLANSHQQLVHKMKLLRTPLQFGVCDYGNTAVVTRC